MHITIKCFFVFYQFCGFSTQLYLDSGNKTWFFDYFYKKIGIIFQICNVLLTMMIFFNGIQNQQDLLVNFKFENETDASDCVMYYIIFGVNFLIPIESWYYRETNKTYVNIFYTLQTTLSKDNFYEKLSKNVAFKHLIGHTILILNNAAHIYMLSTYKDIFTYDLYLIFPFFVIYFRTMQLLFYIQLIQLQQRRVLHLIKSSTYLSLKQKISFVSQAHTKLYYMSQATSKYFGYTFIFISLIFLMNITLALYILISHLAFQKLDDAKSKFSVFSFN